MIVGDAGKVGETLGKFCGDRDTLPIMELNSPGRVGDVDLFMLTQLSQSEMLID